jgi:glycosyltransferase involved in cell wall biosynthesis
MPTPVSVILPVHNAAATVGEALRSLGTAALDDVEIIAVDDGSTDETADVLDALRAEIATLRILRQPQRGIAAALEAGREAAVGSYIARMDADDVALPQRLVRQRRFLDRHAGIGVVSGRVRFGGSRKTAKGYAAYVDWINTLRDPADFSTQRFVESPLAHPAVMFRADCARRHGGYRDGMFPEDYELWLRWMEAGVQFASIPDEVLIWNDPPERLSRSHPRYSIEAFYAMKTEYLARWCALHVRDWPEVIVWGAGRTTRKRAQHLEACGARVRMWVDIDEKKIGHTVGGAPVVGPADLPPPGEGFVIPFVGSRSARKEIRAWLESHGYVLERDFIPAA